MIHTQEIYPTSQFSAWS